MPVIQPPYGSLHRFENAEEMAEAARNAFVTLARSTVDSNGVFRVSLSGGSTPRRLYEMLAQEYLPWEAIEWFWGDERNVPHDHADSNYRMVREVLLDRVAIPDENVFPVPIQVDAPAEAARQYEATLRARFAGEEWPQFDLVLLGMGDDAHTASLFPETDALQSEQRWFVENWVPKFDAHRLTLSAPAINAAANVWFLISGQNKRQAVAHVWGDQHDPRRFPSQLIRPSDGVLWWMASADSLPDVA